MLKKLQQSLGFKSKKAKLTAIFLADNAGEPMKLINSVEAVIDKGLKGDRYYAKTGYWHPVESCQVTLITQHDLIQAKKGSNINFDNGSHRRNLVIDGLKMNALRGKQFCIGEAIFQYEKPRPPCGYINKIEGKGMAKALSYNSGVCIRVIQSGCITIGDELEFLGDV